jgi:hypothetical protein
MEFVVVVARIVVESEVESVVVEVVHIVEWVARIVVESVVEVVHIVGWVGRIEE